MVAFGDNHCRVLDFVCEQGRAGRTSPFAQGVPHPSKDEGRLTILHRKIYLT